MRGSYGVKKVEVLSDGRYKIYWTVPFPDTKYAVAGLSSSTEKWQVTLNVEPHDGYTHNLRGEAARNQFLHKDYVVVGTFANHEWRKVNHNHLVAMTASEDDGCDNSQVFLATYTAADESVDPVATPDTWSFNMNVAGGDGGSEEDECPARYSYRHRLTNTHVGSGGFPAGGYALGGMTENTPINLGGTMARGFLDQKRGVCARDAAVGSNRLRA
jgi:hypothetical protein